MVDIVVCHVSARNHLRNVLFNILRQLESGNGYSATLDHMQYRLDCLYRVLLSCFDAGIVDKRVHCSLHFSLVTDPLFSLQSPSRVRDKITKQNGQSREHLYVICRVRKLSLSGHGPETRLLSGKQCLSSNLIRQKQNKRFTSQKSFCGLGS